MGGVGAFLGAGNALDLGGRGGLVRQDVGADFGRMLGRNQLGDRIVDESGIAKVGVAVGKGVAFSLDRVMRASPNHSPICDSG